MDLSKLPKLSQTPPPPDHTAPVDPVSAHAAQPPSNVELFCQCGAPITPGTNFCSHCGASYYEATGGRPRPGRAEIAGGMWMEAFLSIAIGLLLLMMAPNGIKYLAATLAGKPYTPFLHPTEQNQYVDYLRFQDPTTGAITDYRYRDMFNYFWSDMAVTAFALALILEGIVLALVRNRWVILVSACVIVGVTILNLWYVIASYTRMDPITKQSYGLPLLSVMAVIFGVVMAGYQFRAFTELKRT